jgi:hypothetical protein
MEEPSGSSGRPPHNGAPPSGAGRFFRTAQGGPAWHFFKTRLVKAPLGLFKGPKEGPIGRKTKFPQTHWSVFEKTALKPAKSAKARFKGLNLKCSRCRANLQAWPACLQQQKGGFNRLDD